MKVINVDLKKEYSFLQGGTLEGVLMEMPYDGNAEAWKRPAVIVVPGGGYSHVSKREGFPIATEFLAKGFQVFVLTYTVGEGARYPDQLLQLASAVDFVKKNAEDFRVNANEVFAIGFSAGGHLTANLCVEHQNIQEKAGVALDCSLTAAGLCYPVISKIHGHQGSFEQLLKGYSEEAKAELLKTLNLDQAVNAQTPPAFLWSTVTDGVVPTDNALRYALALDKQGISYELHIYPEGNHGLSTCDLEVNSDLSAETRRAGAWLENCIAFFRRYTVEKF